ncbi:MAG: DUF1801 domain-containing protein [Chloroflexota bacterium]
MTHLPIIENSKVAFVFESYPAETRAKLLVLRQIILETAAETEGVGHLEETLKWGQPSYLTLASKSGSTIRIDQIQAQPGQYAIYFHCQTKLVPIFRHLYPDTFVFEGKRALIFDVQNELPIPELKHCIQLALTYHRDKTVKEWGRLVTG